MSDIPNRAADPNDPRWEEYAQSLRELGWTEDRVKQALSEKHLPERQEDFVGFLGGEWKVELTRATDTELNDLEVMLEIVEDWEDAEVAGSSFEAELEAYYHNLMDDLHDGVGDDEAQAGTLARMEIVERWTKALATIRRYTQAEKDEAGALGPDPTNSDDTYGYLDPNPNA